MLSRILKLFTKPSLTGITLFLLLFPASNNYRLDGFQFGGGEFDQSSTNYQMHSVLGESNEKMKSGNYGLNSGLKFVQMADTPAAPTLTNDDNWTDQLKIVINPGIHSGDDTKFAIAISDDNWVTTQWVQNDNTVDAVLGSEDFQYYSSWGGASGEYIIGLNSNTTYKVRVKAQKGKYTEGMLGPEASASTVGMTLDFDIDIVEQSDDESGPPYVIDFGEIVIGTVYGGAEIGKYIYINLSSSASLGTYVYVYGTNGGLKSASNNYIIESASVDLSSASEGFGLIKHNIPYEDSGGPFVHVAPYNSINNNVGLVDNNLREILNTSGNSIVNGVAGIDVRFRTSQLTPSASDYTEVLTFIAAGTF